MRVLLVILLLAGCSPAAEPVDVGSAPPDLGSDARLVDVVEAEVDSGVAVDQAVPTVQLDAMLDSGGVQVSFDHARYGLTPPSMSGSGAWEIYVEMYRGGELACPVENSPTPDQTVIISGLPVPDAPVVVTEAEGLSVVMLDFEGLVTTEPILRATGEQADISAWSLCADCLRADDPDGFITFELAAPLDDGSIAGRVHATHCPSLDTSP